MYIYVYVYIYIRTLTVALLKAALSAAAVVFIPASDLSSDSACFWGKE